MDKIFIDTDILIDFTYRKNEILYDLLKFQKQGKAGLYINQVVLAEFFTDRKLRIKKNLDEAIDLVSFFVVLDINSKNGLLAGQFLREKQIFAVSDALIAASCMTSNLLLATRNRKHFQKIPGLQFYESSS